MKKRQMTDRLQCNPHPDAPHGFMRDASHNADRYVCECENWEPKPVAHVYRIEPNGRPCVAWDDASEIKVGAKLYAAPREWVGLTDEEIDALSQAPSLTDELMDCVDRLGSEADTVDPRVWQHLLVYAPKPEEEPVAWITNGGKGELWWHRSSKFDEEGNLIGPNQDDIPLYTAPPKKEWIGLTDEEVSYCRYAATFCDELDTAYMAELIEQALKEKNT